MKKQKQKQKNKQNKTKQEKTKQNKDKNKNKTKQEKKTKIKQRQKQKQNKNNFVITCLVFTKSMFLIKSVFQTLPIIYLLEDKKKDNNKQIWEDHTSCVPLMKIISRLE